MFWLERLAKPSWMLRMRNGFRPGLLVLDMGASVNDRRLGPGAKRANEPSEDPEFAENQQQQQRKAKGLGKEEEKKGEEKRDKIKVASRGQWQNEPKVEARGRSLCCTQARAKVVARPAGRCLCPCRRKGEYVGARGPTVPLEGGGP